MDETLLFPCSHGPEAPERATVPFIAAATAATSGQQAVVVCTVEASWLGLAAHAEGVAEEGMPSVTELQQQLVDGGGEIWLCSACATKRGITDDDALVDGARIVGAAAIVDALTRGRAISLT